MGMYDDAWKTRMEPVKKKAQQEQAREAIENVEYRASTSGLSWLSPSNRERFWSTQFPEAKTFRERMNSYSVRRYAEDEAHRAKMLNYAHRRRVKVRGGADFPPKGWLKMLEFYGRVCMACKKTEDDGVKLTLDHIVPINKGGRHTMSNAQILCMSCNVSKSDRHSTDYRPEHRL